jgi:hypothetical protein
MFMKSMITILCSLLCLSLYSQERFVDLDGQKFRIKEFGTGDITVLFECGMSDSIEAWQNIPDSVALFAHVFLYDRSGIGKSDPSELERTIPNMVYELHRILEQESFIKGFFTSPHPLTLSPEEGRRTG